MAFPPNAFALNDGRVYSEWEIHKLATVGVRRFALAATLSAAFLLVLDAIVFRDGRPELALPGWLPKVALGLTLLMSLALFALATARKVELQRPQEIAVLLALALSAGGALAASAGGGRGRCARTTASRRGRRSLNG